ncbi:phage tail tape measure protein [uncultured Roseobacter sp.]|uniref:phage tail tape measure protein n=1 Tax=uncultured Roseobacter sp. TaxID=114847 RepID=UPI00261485D6|nr:phage tail tape measure protein [uncultured Roseobacter sp.]
MFKSVIGALRVNLGLDSARFKKGLTDSQAALRKAGRSMKQTGRNLSAAVSVPIVGLAALTVKTAGDFEASMNRVKAASGATGGELADLRAAAREMGATTQFSASESADAVEVLAKNGLNASQILGGALAASLTLAAASGSDLATAGDIATDVMLQFKKEAGELGGVVDGISGTLVNSKFDIDDYRLALAQAGGVAGGLGVEFDDFNAVIAATSSRFASGSDAGTAFKTFLQRLVPQSDGAKDAMEELGLTFFDAEGNMNSMSEIAETLRNGLSGLSEEARSEALTKIFGTDALRTAIGLMDAGAAGIDNISAAIDRVSAQEQAAARMQGFNGAMKELRSAFEELQLAIADSGLLDFAAGLVAGLTNVVKAISAADPKVLKFGTVFAGLAAALGPALIALGLAATAVAAVGAPVAGVIAGIGALGAVLATFWPEIKAAATAVQDFGGDVVTFLSELPAEIVAVFSALPGQMLQIGRDILDGLLQGLRDKYEGVKASITGFGQGVIDGFKETFGIQSPSRVFKEIGTDIMLGLGHGLAETGKHVQATMQEITGGLSSEIDGLLEGVLLNGASFKKSLAGIFGNLKGQVFSNATSGLSEVLTGLIPGFAMGTSFAPGGLAMVGERGPELVNLPRGSQVIPNHQLGGATITQNLTINAGASSDPRAIADVVRPVIRQETLAVLERSRRERR